MGTSDRGPEVLNLPRHRCQGWPCSHQRPPQCLRSRLISLSSSLSFPDVRSSPFRRTLSVTATAVIRRSSGGDHRRCCRRQAWMQSSAAMADLKAGLNFAPWSRPARSERVARPPGISSTQFRNAIAVVRTHAGTSAGRFTLRGRHPYAHTQHLSRPRSRSCGPCPLLSCHLRVLGLPSR